MSSKNTINKHWFRLSQWTKTEVTDQDKYWASHKWTASLPDALVDGYIVDTGYSYRSDGIYPITYTENDRVNRK